jgi:large subunit ribosomal protein L7/L12
MAEKAKTEVKKEKKEVEVPAKFKSIVDEIEKMSVLDLSELVKILEEKFGVTANAPMAVAAAPGAEADAAGAEEEKSAYTIHLAAVGDQKINVIKVTKEITGLGLKEAKDLVDGAPKDLKTDVKKEEAEEMKKKLEDAGATVELK